MKRRGHLLERLADLQNLYEAFYKAQTGLWSQKEFANHAMPLVAFTEYANAREFRKNVYRTLVASEG